MKIERDGKNIIITASELEAMLLAVPSRNGTIDDCTWECPYIEAKSGCKTCQWGCDGHCQELGDQVWNFFTEKERGLQIQEIKNMAGDEQEKKNS